MTAYGSGYCHFGVIWYFIGLGYWKNFSTKVTSQKRFPNTR